MTTDAPLAGVKGITFDLDDTLCGYWKASRIGLRKAFEAHPAEQNDPEAMLDAWATAFHEYCPNLKRDGWYERYCESGEVTRTEQMRRTLAKLGIEDEAHAQALSQTYMVERDAALELFPEAEEVLTRLAGLFPLALMTNGPADIQRQEVATTGVERFFRHFFIEGEQKIGKPKEEVFRRCEKAMGLGPDEMVMVGNSYKHDVLGAMDAGWRAVYVRRTDDRAPSAKNDEHMEPTINRQPTATIHHLTELYDLLGLD